MGENQSGKAELDDQLDASAKSPVRGGRNWTRRQLVADLLLLLVALVWGSTFVMVKRAVADVPVYAFLSKRFLLAAVVLAAVYSRRIRRMTRRQVGAGCLIGVFLFAGYAFQTSGLQYTTSAKVGFITGLSVVIVPILSAALLRRAPTRQSIIGVVFSTVGLGLLSLNADLSVGRGDLLVLFCAVSFAFHIVAVSAFAPKCDPIALTTVQVATVGVVSVVVALACGQYHRLTGAAANSTWFAAAFTGVLATAVAFGIQNSAQRFTSPTHTALIFAAEPVFAGLFGVLLAGEELSQRAVAGCVLILCGMIAGEIDFTEEFAEGLSKVFNPFSAGVPLVFIASFHDGTGQSIALVWALFGVTTAILMPGSFLLWQLKRGKISDWHISRREERTTALMTVMWLTSTAVPVIVTHVAQGPRALQALFVTEFCLAIITLLITTFWKISQHAGGIASLSTMLVALVGPAAAPALLLVPLVGWARVRVKAHTPAQVVAGAMLGFVVSSAVFSFYRLL